MSASDRDKLIRKLQVPLKGRFHLAKVDPAATPVARDRATAEAELEKNRQRMAERQEVLYAQGKHAVLVVLQAMDTGGKDGTIRRVFTALNPQGIEVTSFKKPTLEELSHDYLWRIHRAVPPRGMIGVFNRSHYEDVLVVRVHGLAPRREVDARYEQINAFERHLAANGVTIVKIMLHIGRDEQRARLQARLDRGEKRWKFNPADLDERARWDEYMRAYELALNRCNTPWAPWFVVPANHKWFRNYAVSAIVRHTLDRLDLAYPAPPDLPKDARVE